MEKKAEVAMEMSDLVVYCQPRSKEKDRFGKHLKLNTPQRPTLFRITKFNHSLKVKLRFNSPPRSEGHSQYKSLIMRKIFITGSQFH